MKFAAAARLFHPKAQKRLPRPGACSSSARACSGNMVSSENPDRILIRDSPCRIMLAHLPDPLLKTVAHLEARAELGPFVGLHRTAAVQVGTQVPVPHNAPYREIPHQHLHQHLHRVLLCLGARVGGPSVPVKTPFVGDADARGVMPLRMCPRPLHRPHRADGAVRADIIVVAATSEPSLPVHPRQFGRRERFVRSRSRTVDDDGVNLSHSLSFLFLPVRIQMRHLNILSTIHFTFIPVSHFKKPGSQSPVRHLPHLPLLLLPPTLSWHTSRAPARRPGW